MQGIINLNKPQGMTSHDCVGMIRRLTGIKKVGHAGTLDPMATGVLPVCVGRATRIMQYLDDEKKEYVCGMLLGRRTDTQDIWGTTLEEVIPDEEQLRRVTDVLKGFEGDILQTPPMYSALKYKGKKLYEYARKGIEIEVKPRKIHVDEIEILNIKYYYVTFRILCGRGTYVRSICDEAGRILGCGACMSSLERTLSAGLRIEESVDVDALKEMTAEEIEAIIYPPYYPLDMEKIYVTPEEANRLIDGKHIPFPDRSDVMKSAKGGRFTVFEGSRFIGIIHVGEDGMMIPEKIFDTEKK